MSEGTHTVDRQERAARNQSLFREINERVEALNVAFNDLLPLGDWVCECADDTCVERVFLSLKQYEAVRSESTRFVVLPGHVDEAVEKTVERTDGYWVVEKIEVAAEIARETDPRR